MSSCFFDGHGCWIFVVSLGPLGDKNHDDAHVIEVRDFE